MKRSSLLKDTFMISFTKVLNMGITFISSMLLARFRSLQEYGTYSQITTVVSLASAVFMLGLPRSLNYFIAKADSNEERDHFISVYYIFATVLSLFAGVVLLFGKNIIISYYDNDQIGRLSYLLLLLPWAQVITEGVSNMLVASGRTRQLLVYNISRSISFLLIIIGIQLLNQDFYTYMIAYMVVDIIFTIVVYIEAFRIIDKFYFRFELKRIKRILIYAIPIGISSALSTLNIQLDHLMVGRMFSTEDLAVYSYAAKELPFTFIATSFSAVLLPKMVRLLKNNESKRAVDIWKNCVEFNAYILFFGCMCCIVFAPQIVILLYSDKYISGVQIFRIYSLIFLMRITYFGMILNAKGKTKFILYSTITALIINCILNYIFMRCIGMAGAAVATVLSMAVVGFAQLFLSSRMIGVSISNIFPWKKLSIILLKNLFVGVIAILILKYFNIGIYDNDIIISIVIGICCIIVYGLLSLKRIKTLLYTFNHVET